MTCHVTTSSVVATLAFTFGSLSSFSFVNLKLSFHVYLIEIYYEVVGASGTLLTFKRPSGIRVWAKNVSVS